MSKRNYTHMNEYEAVILTMRQSGYTRREIADEFPCMVNLLISVKEYLHPADKHTCGKFGGFEQKIRPDMRTWGRLKRGMMAEIESFGGKWWVWLPETSGDVTRNSGDYGNGYPRKICKGRGVDKSGVLG